MQSVLPKHINRKIGLAMHEYRMLADQDTVLLAVSGGVDSLLLAWILAKWQEKAPISYALHAIHIDHGYSQLAEKKQNPQECISSQLNKWGISLLVEQSRIAPHLAESCFHCARSRRNQLFDLAQKLGCTKIAFGHHRDDLIETFFLNLLYSGNISTMVPRQDLFEGRLAVIRPLAYLTKAEIVQLAEAFGLQPVENLCPHAKNNKREKIRELLETIKQFEPNCERSIFSALANIRHDYLL